MLKKYGKQLWTRDRARDIRTEAESVLAKLDVGDVLVIDTKGVDVFDYSFANELFGRLILNTPRDYPGRFLLVEGLTAYARENLLSALTGMGLAIIERRTRIPGLLGKVHPSDSQTFDVIARAKSPITAAELANKLEVNLNAMNERLTKLLSLGLVRRQESASPAGRAQYEYQVLR